MLKAKCNCGKELTEEDFVACCDRCGKPISDEMLAEAVMFMVSPGDEDPDGEGPQFLAVLSTDINGDPDGNQYCKTCTSFLLDQSFLRQMREAQEVETEPDEPTDEVGEMGEDKEPEGEGDSDVSEVSGEESA